MTEPVQKKLNMKKVVGTIVLIVLLILLISYATSDKPAMEGSEDLTVDTEEAMEESMTESETIRIGSQLPLTGDVATVGVPMRQGIELAVKEINADGGVDGKTLEVIFEDSKCDPKLAATATQKLISIDKVPAIVGDVCSSATLAAAPIAEEGKVVLISPSSTSPDVTDAGDYIFRNVASDAYQGVEAANLADKMGIDKLAILYENTDYGVGLKDVLVDEAEKRGVIIEGMETFEQRVDRDFRAQLTKIDASSAEAVYIIVVGEQGGLIMKQADELGMDVQLLGSEGLKDPEVIELAADAAEGLIITVPAENKDAKYQSFAAAYEEEFGEEPGVYVAESYDAVFTIKEAIESSDGSARGIKNALYKLGEWSGAAGTIEFDQNGDVVKPYDYLQVVDGDFEQYELE